MKKLYTISLITTLSLLVMQPVLADTDLAPQTLCGGMDPVFSYANSKLNIQLNEDANQHSNNHPVAVTSKIFPVFKKEKDAKTSKIITTKYFIACAAINYLSNTPLNNNALPVVGPEQICGDEFGNPTVAVNILKEELDKKAALHSDKHMLISSFQVNVGSNNDDTDLSTSVFTQNFYACATVNYQ